MKQKEITLTVIFAAIGFDSLTQINSAFADAHDCNGLFVIGGIIGIIAAIGVFIYGKSKS